MDQQLRNAYEVEFPTSTNKTTTANSGSITCTPSSGMYNGVMQSGGVQPCNVVDVLARSVSTSDTATDYEIRVDCTNGTCWQYRCTATYNTGSSSSCTSSTSGRSKTLIESSNLQRDERKPSVLALLRERCDDGQRLRQRRVTPERGIGDA